MKLIKYQCTFCGVFLEIARDIFVHPPSEAYTCRNRSADGKYQATHARVSVFASFEDVPTRDAESNAVYPEGGEFSASAPTLQQAPEIPDPEPDPAPILLQGKLTMLDALKYIHNDNRFWARPKGSTEFAVQRTDRNTWMMRFNVEGNEYQGSPHIFKPATLFAEWEIIRPEQVPNNLNVEVEKADV